MKGLDGGDYALRRILVEGIRTFLIFLEAIKFEHTIFALPFALIGMLYAADGFPPARTVFWILVAMVGARTSGMAFNRLVDREVDALNPRTARRALPAGLLSVGQMQFFLWVAMALFILAAWQLNPLCLKLSPLALFILLSYSYTKYFTPLSHFWLGLSLGIAPTAAWIAVRARLDLPPLWLTLAVLFWVAGFDILYSLQDYEFDKAHRLRSLPESVGKVAAIQIARLCHLLCVGCLLAGGVALQAGWLYFTGVGLTTLLLLYEHTLVKPDDLNRINTAFFTVNGFVSIGLFVFVLLDRWLLGGIG